MEFEIIKRDEFFEARLKGSLDADAFDGLFKSLCSQDAWEDNSKILYDLSELNATNLDPGDMIDIIDFCETWREEIGRGQSVFVAPKKTQYQFAHIFMRRTMFKWDVEMETFDDRPKALHWLLGDADSQHLINADGLI
jgi:hypothetical protein